MTNRYEPSKWTTRDGREIPVSEMSDSHLQNTISLLRRSPWLADRAAEFKMNELVSIHRYMGSAPDGAAYAAEIEAHHLDEQPLDYWRRRVLPVYDTLLKEAKRRNICLGGGEVDDEDDEPLIQPNAPIPF